MKKRWLYITFIMIHASVMAQRPSLHDTLRYWIVQPVVGYTSFELSEVKSFYNEVLNEYKSMGLSIPTQQFYPGTISYGFTTLYNVPGILRVGATVNRASTKAYSGYEDYAGLLEINSTISITTLEIVVERDLSSFSFGSIYLGAAGGLSFVKSDYANFVTLHEYPTETGEIKLKGDGQGHSVQLYIGGTYAINRITFSLTAGYRFAVVKEIDGTIQIPMEGSFTGKIDLEHDLSGILVSAKIGYKIFR